MTNDEYSIIDELYFITSFHNLCKESGMEAGKVKEILKGLLIKGLVKLMNTEGTEEMVYTERDFENNIEQYMFLVTKKGLQEHNSI